MGRGNYVTVFIGGSGDARPQRHENPKDEGAEKLCERGEERACSSIHISLYCTIFFSCYGPGGQGK